MVLFPDNWAALRHPCRTSVPKALSAKMPVSTRRTVPESFPWPARTAAPACCPLCRYNQPACLRSCTACFVSLLCHCAIVCRSRCAAAPLSAAILVGRPEAAVLPLLSMSPAPVKRNPGPHNGRPPCQGNLHSCKPAVPVYGEDPEAGRFQRALGNAVAPALPVPVSVRESEDMLFPA